MIVIDAAPGLVLAEAITVVVVESAGVTFAMPADAVAMVTPPVPVTPVPLVPTYVDGLAGLGAAIVPQICLRRRLGLPKATSDTVTGGELLVVVAADGNYALRVDHVVTLARLERDTVQVFVAVGSGQVFDAMGADSASGTGVTGGPGGASEIHFDGLPSGAIVGEFPWRGRTVLLLHPELIGLCDIAGRADAMEQSPVATRVGGLASPAPAEPHHVYVVARCGEGRYALPVEQVAEVVPAGPVTSIPGAPPEVLGICQLRGRPLPVLVPALLAGELNGAGVLVVVNTALGRFALRVDAVTGIQRFPLSRIHADAGGGAVEGRAGYLVDTGERVIGLLDADRLAAAGEASTWRALLPPVEVNATTPITIAPTRKLLVFRLGNEWCAIDATLVIQITGYRPPLPLPESSIGLAGVIEIGADVMPVVDLRMTMAMPAPFDEFTAMIVVNNEGCNWAVITDRIDRLIAVPEMTIHTAEAPLHALVTSVVQLGDRLVSLLDLTPLFRKD
ncbi:MAG: chemotaxis protein CheW [Rhodospirillaceae bacterium]